MWGGRRETQPTLWNLYLFTLQRIKVCVLCKCECASRLGGHTVQWKGLILGIEDHIHPKKVNSYVRAEPPPPPLRDQVALKTFWGPYSPNDAHLGKRYRTQVDQCPHFCGGGSGQIKSQTSSRCPVGGPSASGLLLAWSLGCLGWNLTGKWGPTMEGHYLCLGWVPLPPWSVGPKNGVPGSLQSKQYISGQNYTKKEDLD